MQRLMWCHFRGLDSNLLNGPFPTGVLSLAKLTKLYVPAADPSLRWLPRAILLCRGLSDNRFSGTVPNAISILSALSLLCVGHCVVPSASRCGPQPITTVTLWCVLPRLLNKNAFVGTIPETAALIPKLSTVYAPCNLSL